MGELEQTSMRKRKDKALHEDQLVNLCPETHTLVHPSVSQQYSANKNLEEDVRDL